MLFSPQAAVFYIKDFFFWHIVAAAGRTSQPSCAQYLRWAVSRGTALVCRAHLLFFFPLASEGHSTCLYQWQKLVCQICCFQTGFVLLGFVFIMCNMYFHICLRMIVIRLLFICFHFNSRLVFLLFIPQCSLSHLLLLVSVEVGCPCGLGGTLPSAPIQNKAENTHIQQCVVRSFLDVCILTLYQCSRETCFIHSTW